MRISWRLWFRVALLVIVIALIWIRLIPHGRSPAHFGHRITDLGGYQSNEPTRWRTSSRGSVRRVLRALSGAKQGSAGIRGIFDNRYPAGGWQLSEALDATGACDDRCLRRGQSAEPSVGAEIHHPAGIPTAAACRGSAGTSLPGYSRTRRWLRELQTAKVCSLSGSSRIRRESHASAGIGDQELWRLLRKRRDLRSRERREHVETLGDKRFHSQLQLDLLAIRIENALFNERSTPSAGRSRRWG